MIRPVVLRLFISLAVFGGVVAAGVPALAGPETPRIQSITISPNRVDAGASPSTGTITLTFAPTTNVTINLRSSNTQAATVPGSVVVPKGQKQATFTVNIGKPSATANVSISGMLGNLAAGSLIVQVQEAAKVQAISLNPATVAAGASVRVVVKLNTMAPQGGQQVALSYNPASLVSGPSSVTVPERAVATEVEVQAGNPATQSVAQIKASINNAGATAPLTIRGSAPIVPKSAFVTPSRLRSEETGTLTVVVSNPAPPGGSVVSLSSSSPSILSVPSTLTVPAGEISGRASVTVKPVQKSGTLNVTATMNGVSAKAPVDIVGAK